MRFLIPFFATLFLPAWAFAEAHAHGTAGGFASGFNHPVLGLDHLLAMVAVGVVSAQVAQNGYPKAVWPKAVWPKAVWTVPACFVIVMAIGGALGMADVGLVAIEIGIAVSVIALGLAIAGGGQISQWILFACVSGFAVFHGYAHGQEIPALVNSGAYVTGFMTGTAVLHLAGVGIGYFITKIPDGASLLRYSGAVVAGMGLHILLGLAGY